MNKKENLMKHAAVRSGIAWLRERELALPIGVFLLAYIISSTPIGTVYPFGFALLSAAFGVRATVASFSGAMLSTLSLKPTAAIPCISAYIVVLSVRYIISLASQSEEGRRRLLKIENALARIIPISKPSERTNAALFSESLVFRCALASLASLTASMLELLLYGSGKASFLAFALIGAVLSPVGAYLYAPIFSDGIVARAGRKTGGALLLFSIMLSLASFTVLGFKLSVALAFAVSLYATEEFGVSGGVLAAVISGIALNPVYAAVYPVAAIAYAVFKRFHRVLGCVAAGAAACFFSVYSNGTGALGYMWPELIAAAGTATAVSQYRLLPRLGERKKRKPTASDPAVSAERCELAESDSELDRLSRALSSCSDIFTKLSDCLSKPTLAELKQLCDRECDKSCAKCGRLNECWGSEYSGGNKMISRWAAQLRADGRVSSSAAPTAIAENCVLLPDIMDGINASYGERLKNASMGGKSEIFALDYGLSARMLSEIKEKRKAEFSRNAELSERAVRLSRRFDFFANKMEVYGQRTLRIWADGIDLSLIRLGGEDIRLMFSEILGCRLATPEFEIDGESVSMKTESVPRYSAEVGASRYSANEDEMCGDASAVFDGQNGYFYSIISDGMGTGREAALVSNVCAVYLEKMLGIGAGMETVLEGLNGLLCSMNLECSSTVDIAEFDLINGGAKFVKSGAAPTFIMREGKVFKLQSKTVPIGIMRALDAEMIKFEIKSEDVIVMMSDGVAESFEEATWLLDMLCDRKLLAMPCETVAARIAKEARRNGEKRDDITVSVLRIKETK